MHMDPFLLTLTAVLAFYAAAVVLVNVVVGLNAVRKWRRGEPEE